MIVVQRRLVAPVGDLVDQIGRERRLRLLRDDKILFDDHGLQALGRGLPDSPLTLVCRFSVQIDGLIATLRSGRSGSGNMRYIEMFWRETRSWVFGKM